MGRLSEAPPGPMTLFLEGGGAVSLLVSEAVQFTTWHWAIQNCDKPPVFQSPKQFELNGVRKPVNIYYSFLFLFQSRING